MEDVELLRLKDPAHSLREVESGGDPPAGSVEKGRNAFADMDYPVGYLLSDSSGF